MDQSVLHRLDDYRRGRSDHRLIGAEQTIQPKYLWLRRYDDTLVTWAHVRPLSTFGKRPVGHGNGADGGKVEHKVRAPFGGDEGLGGLVKRENVITNKLAREARPREPMVPIKFNMEHAMPLLIMR